ncbi:GTPase-activating protein [Mortierella claussenii]|nr:GTPase-activating protein [Mortierella claussenii]
MMVNKRGSFTSQDGKDYDPIDTYAAASDAEPNSGHGLPYASKEYIVSAGRPLETTAAAPEKHSRNSWEESYSDDDPYPADAYTYGRETDSEEEEEKNEDKDRVDGGVDNRLQDIILGHQQQQQPQQDHRTFDQALDDDDTLPNRNLFRDSAVNPRPSINSGRSYSSHTKHHSFGYEKDRPEPSESESESNTESESDRGESFANAPSSPPLPSMPITSRPTSSTASATKVPSKPSSPTLSRSAMSPTSDIKYEEPLIKENASVASSSQSSPTRTRAAVNGSPSTTSTGQVREQRRSSLLKLSAQAARRASGSGSDTSDSVNGLRSPSLNGHFHSTSKSGASSLRGFGQGRFPLPHRPSSYSDLSDAELNEISLDEPSGPTNAQQRSNGGTTAAPRAPVASSNAGFPSSFFGGKPHPKSQQLQHQQPSLASPQPVPVAAAAPPLPLSAPSISPEPRAGSVLNGSISSFASTIQGAFMGRAFGGSGNSSTLPPSGTPSRPSIRGTNGDMTINTSSTSVDSRSSNNVSPERASTYSTMTTDSNMDLLLARLESQNSMLEQDSKRRMTNESDMDRALGHAKEESVGEDVDWDYWGALMHDYNGVVKKNPKQLTQMIQKGVPPALRGLIWQLLSKSKDAQLEANYAELLKATSSHEKQINRDMSRTFPNHEYFQAEGLGQESLFNVVKAYSLYDTEVGYCQGLSFVVGPLLLNMPDEEAFCVLVRMMNSYDMRGHFTPDMNMLQLRLYQLEQLMEETVPLIYKHFQNQGIRSTMYASQWFMTLFAYKFPLDLVFRVYDILFVEGVESLLRFAIALLKANHDRILNHDFETLIEFLKNGLFEHYKDNPSLFVQDAYNVKVTPKKLAQYAQKYTAMVQRQQAELAAEESLRETNRQLSAHVRRLEGSVHTLNKEHVELAKELISRKMEMAHLQDQNDVLLQKVTDLTKIVDSQAKEVEDRLRADIQSVMEKNMELVRKNEQVEDQCALLEAMLIETKMKYAESENERDALTRKLSDLRKALGVV